MGRRLGHGCRRVWFDTVLRKTSARLTTNGCSPTAGLGQAPSTKSGQALPLAQGWLSTDRVRGPFAARGSWVSWLPFETLPLGTHKGHPYSGRADYKRGGVRCWVASGRGRFETGPTQLLRKTSAGMTGWLGASGVWFPSAGSGQAHQESERGTMRRWAGGRRKRVVRRLVGSTGDPRSQAARSLGR